MPLIYILIAVIFILLFILLYVMLKLRSFYKVLNNDIKEEKNNIDINKDNTDFDLDLDKKSDEFKKESEEILLNILDTIENKDINKLDLSSNLIYLKLENIIKKQDELNQREYFNGIKILDNNLINFEELNGYFSLIYKLDISYIHYIKKDDDIIYGDDSKIINDSYNLSIGYIYDKNKLDKKTLNTKFFNPNSNKVESLYDIINDIELNNKYFGIDIMKNPSN